MWRPSEDTRAQRHPGALAPTLPPPSGPPNLDKCLDKEDRPFYHSPADYMRPPLHKLLGIASHQTSRLNKYKPCFWM